MTTIKQWNGSSWETIVVGKQGPQGPTGPTGPAGETGPTGLTGPAGVVAATSPITYNSETQTVGLDRTAENTTNDARYARLGASNAFTVGGHTITNASDIIGLLVKGNAIQTANLQEWQNSTGTVLSSITSTGVHVAPVGSVSAPSYRFGPLATTGMWASATAETLNFSTRGNAALSINGSSAGSAAVGATNAHPSNNAIIFQTTNTIATQIGIVAQGVAAQTGNLEEWRASGGVTLGGSNALGQIFTGSTAPINVTIVTNATGTSSGTTATITTSTTSHGLAAGDLVTISGMTPSGYNGTYLVASILSGTQFTVTTSGSNLGAGTGGTVANPAQASATARSAGTVGLVVRGAASQTANLQEWQNSGGTILGRISSTGAAQFASIDGGTA